MISGLNQLLSQNPSEPDIRIDLLQALDISIGILFTELLETGFSKGFLYRYLYGAFVNNLDDTTIFQYRFDEFISRIKNTQTIYNIVFRVDTTSKVRQAIQPLENDAEVYDLLEGLEVFAGNKEFDNFNTPRKNRFFIKCKIIAPDYLTGLKIAKATIAENLDVLNLGFADEYLIIHSRVLVIDTGNIPKAQFQESKNFLDGKYKVAKEHYEEFILKLPQINANTKIIQETKDKIKSAIRYLRLGNESTEVEHKFINYWIGLEYLFSNYESNNTINRIKDYFVACHALNYVKRNTLDFFKSVLNLQQSEISNLEGYSSDPISSLTNPQFYQSIFNNMLDTHPLLAYRAKLLSEKLCPVNGPAKINHYVTRHQKNLMIHFTRIYRLRNEIIHDAATNTNNESIASNLRYYLTFILNGIIYYLSTSSKDKNCIEDYFTLNEIYLGNIEFNGWQLEQLLRVTTSMEFIQ